MQANPARAGVKTYGWIVSPESRGSASCVPGRNPRLIRRADSAFA